MVARYTQALGIDEPLAMLRGNTTSYYHADGLGSVTSLSDSRGNLVSTYRYDSFGNLTASTGSISNPFRYTGREFDAETGLYFYRARHYDPSSGRFISEDPIGLLGGINMYAYVSNDPGNWIDPLGLAQIGSRPLDSKWIPFNGYGQLRYDQIWYDDGTNSGFFDDDTIRPDKNHTRNDYNFCRDPKHYDDNLMRKAERNVQENWDMDCGLETTIVKIILMP